MTHGRSAKVTPNSRTKNRGTPLTGFSEDSRKRLEQQVEDMAARVAELETRVDRLAGIAPGYYYGEPENTKKKSGPDQRMSDAELFRSRDGLVGWLEEVWPKIVRPLLSANDPSQVAAILKKVARPKDIQPPWQSRLLAHPAKLLDFLQSNKFRRKPPKKTVVDALNRPGDDEKRMRAANRLPTRQIANAMAGVPKVQWRTSLDRCSKSPCSYEVGLIADAHYRAMFGIPVPQARTPVR